MFKPFITGALNDIYYKFIWDPKPDKLNRNKLKMVDIEHIVFDIDKVVLFGLVGHDKRQNKLTNFSGKMPGTVYYRTFAKSVIFMKKNICA